MVEDSGTDEEIPLPNVKTAILSKARNGDQWHVICLGTLQVIDYCRLCGTGSVRSLPASCM